MLKKTAALGLLLTSLFAGAIKAQDTGHPNYIVIQPSDTYSDIIGKAAQVTPSDRQLRWQQLELTAFLHFGINTFTGQEWGDGTADPKIFNPARLDARQWVRTLKVAGFKQVILTAKHHDGFCLWPSKFTAYSVKNSPWKNGSGDVVREVADACKAYGMGFGIYLSPWDRHYPDYGDSAKYNAYFLELLSELLTNYGRVDEVWFDGANGTGPNGKVPVYDWDAYYRLIRKLQPGAVIAVMGPDVRWVATESGYGRKTEWSVLPADANMLKATSDASQKDAVYAPAGDKSAEDLGGRALLLRAKGLVWSPAETDVSIRPGWFYHPAQDSAVKSPAELMAIYFASVGRNSVLLLNVPPDKDGLISESDRKALRGWSAARKKLFAVNLARGASVSASNGKNANAILDGNAKHYFIANPGDSSVSLTVKLRKAVSFDVLLLQENIKVGQRIEQFVLDYKDGRVWKQAAEGTTVGYKRLLRFPPVTARFVRLRIISSRRNPTVAAFGLYKD